MKPLIITIASILMLSSCNSTINKKIDIATAKEDIETLKAKYKNDYTEADFEFLTKSMAGNILKKAFSGENLDEKIKLDKTYKDILEESKAKRLEYETKLGEYNLEVERFKTIIKAGITDRRVDGKYEYEKELGLYILFENKGEKDIKAVKGHFEVYDLFDNFIRRLSLEQTELIKAKSKVNAGFVWTVGYNEDMKKIAYQDLTNLNFIWFPEIIIYADGTKDTAPALPEK